MRNILFVLAFVCLHVTAEVDVPYRPSAGNLVIIYWDGSGNLVLSEWYCGSANIGWYKSPVPLYQFLSWGKYSYAGRTVAERLSYLDRFGFIVHRVSAGTRPYFYFDSRFSSGKYLSGALRPAILLSPTTQYYTLKCGLVQRYGYSWAGIADILLQRYLDETRNYNVFLQRAKQLCLTYKGCERLTPLMEKITTDLVDCLFGRGSYAPKTVVPARQKGNNGLGNGVDPAPKGIEKQGKEQNDGSGTPGNPQNKGGKK